MLLGPVMEGQLQMVLVMVLECTLTNEGHILFYLKIVSLFISRVFIVLCNVYEAKIQFALYFMCPWVYVGKKETWGVGWGWVGEWLYTLVMSSPVISVSRHMPPMLNAVINNQSHSVSSIHQPVVHAEDVLICCEEQLLLPQMWMWFFPLTKAGREHKIMAQRRDFYGTGDTKK